MSDLAKLEQMLVEAKGPDREIDRALLLACGILFLDEQGKLYRLDLEGGGRVYGGQGDGVIIWHVTASVDDALALVERVKPPWVGIIHLSIAGSGQASIESAGPCDSRWAQAFGETPALAICLALVRALIASKAEGEEPCAG